MQTHKQEYGSFHQCNIQATEQNFHASTLIPLKPKSSKTTGFMGIEQLNDLTKKILSQEWRLYIPGLKIPHQAVYWHPTS